MALIYVKDMTNAQLDKWTARAQGDFYVRGYKPTENWSQCGPLIDKFELEVLRSQEKGKPKYFAFSIDPKYGDESILDDVTYGSTPQEAICRAVVAAVYGEYVEVDDE